MPSVPSRGAAVVQSQLAPPAVDCLARSPREPNDFSGRQRLNKLVLVHMAKPTDLQELRRLLAKGQDTFAVGKAA